MKLLGVVVILLIAIFLLVSPTFAQNTDRPPQMQGFWVCQDTWCLALQWTTSCPPSGCPVVYPFGSIVYDWEPVIVKAPAWIHYSLPPGPHRAS